MIAAFASAIASFQFDREDVREKSGLLAAELKKIQKVYINSPVGSHIVSVSVEGVLLKDLLERMQNFAFSSGCSCLGTDQSNVLAAIDPQGELPSCTIRISFSDKTSARKLVIFAQKLKQEVEALRRRKTVKNSCEKISGQDQEKLKAYMKNMKK